MPMPKGTKQTDAQRRAKNKYSLAHFKTLACKIDIETAERFTEKARASGSTANKVLTDFVMRYLEK